MAFKSRVLTKIEVNYATTKREASGVVQAMQWFRPYIYGTQCIVRTDHATRVYNGCSDRTRME